MPPAVVLFAQYTNAAFDTHIKFDSVEGESNDKDHKGWIELTSFSFGISNPPTIEGGVIKPGVAKAMEFKLNKPLDRSSPPLFLACAQGKVFESVVLEMSSSVAGENPKVFYRITLTNVVLGSLKTSREDLATKPVEDLSVAYEHIKIEYLSTDSGFEPVPAASWDFMNNSDPSK